MKSLTIIFFLLSLNLFSQNTFDRWNSSFTKLENETYIFDNLEEIKSNKRIRNLDLSLVDEFINKEKDYLFNLDSNKVKFYSFGKFSLNEDSVMSFIFCEDNLQLDFFKVHFLKFNLKSEKIEEFLDLYSTGNEFIVLDNEVSVVFNNSDRIIYYSGSNCYFNSYLSESHRTKEMLVGDETPASMEDVLSLYQSKDLTYEYDFLKYFKREKLKRYSHEYCFLIPLHSFYNSFKLNEEILNLFGSKSFSNLKIGIINVKHLSKKKVITLSISNFSCNKECNNIKVLKVKVLKDNTLKVRVLKAR